MYDANNVEIPINGINVSHFDPEEFRKLFGVVFRDFGRFQMSLRENIGFGDLNNISN